ncbi:MAG: phosphatidylinositol-specific phospholipase C/glycerophosphodiester phosphodiesterase family protein [Verrucomicrobiales bacterium]
MVWMLIGLAATTRGQGSKPVHPQAHSHNDYLQRRPLLDALDNGFCGVEADVFLVGGQLLVAHDLEKTDPSRTLETLYLEPLRTRVEQHRGKVHSTGPSLLLLIDIKTNGAAVYPVLMKHLDRYKTILTYAEEGRIHTNAVTVVLSGDRPRELIARAKKRYAFLDGRFEDIDRGENSNFMPLVSDNWKKHFTWTGEGPMNEQEINTLKRYVQAVRAEGKQIRLWGAPDHPQAWAILRESGVDWINTDHLQSLAHFLSNSEK